MLEKRVESKWCSLCATTENFTLMCIRFPCNSPGNMHHVPSVNITCLVSVEGLRVVEIEKCKNDLRKLRDEMTSRGSGR